MAEVVEEERSVSRPADAYFTITASPVVPCFTARGTEISGRLGATTRDSNCIVLLPPLTCPTHVQSLV